MAVKKYIKPDSEKGYLEDKDDINYFATSQMKKVAFGCMLGDFDENGVYVVNEKIVGELIKMPKVIVENVEGVDLIRSKVKADAFFHFILSIEGNKARLSLLEKINYQSNRNLNSGAYSNINEYLLDEVIVPDKDVNRDALYQKYNIATEDDGDVLSIFDMDELSIALYYNLTEKIKANYLTRNKLVLTEKESEQIEADYFEAVLEAASAYADFEGKVLTDFKANLAEKHSFVIPTKPFYQSTINEILDSVIEMCIQDLNEEDRNAFLIKIREIKAEYYKKYKQLLAIHIEREAGVKLDRNKLLEEGVIGSLSREIETKGYTASDVRRIAIDDSELQLDIAKIKSILHENLTISEQDHSRVKDITKGRKRTADLYKQIEQANIANVKDEPLIKSSIEDNSAKTSPTATKAGASASPAKAAAKPDAKKPAKKEAKAGAKKADKGGAKKEAKKDAKKDTKKEIAKTAPTKAQNQPTASYGRVYRTSGASGTSGTNETTADDKKPRNRLLSSLTLATANGAKRAQTPRPRTSQPVQEERPVYNSEERGLKM